MNETPPSPDTEAIVQQLTTAVTNLTWISESEAPFDPFWWPGGSEEALTPAQLLAYAQLPSDTVLQETTLDILLDPVIQPQPWHTDAERTISAQFQALKTLLALLFHRIYVYSCGTIQRDIYILGAAAIGGDWIGLHTTAIET